jgi:YegS/Rv2252/BmrU family lipid kinase
LIHRTLTNCEIIYVSEPEELVSISIEAAKRSSVVVACGGDGTAQSVAQGIHGSKALMGLIPVGSGNDFAKSIGLKTKQNIEYYLNVLLKRELLQVDMPKINEQIFVNTAGIGFDGLTNYYASQFRFLKGMMKYTVAGLKAFLTARPFLINGVIDDEKLSKKVWLVAVANGAIEGGKYVISPASKNSDGILDLVIVPAYSRIKLGIAFIILSFGKTLPDSFSEVCSFKKASLNIQKKHFIHLDGEVGTSSSQYQIELKNEPLNVIGVKPFL